MLQLNGSEISTRSTEDGYKFLLIPILEKIEIVG
jgi:hypothetical protein